MVLLSDSPELAHTTVRYVQKPQQSMIRWFAFTGPHPGRAGTHNYRQHSNQQRRQPRHCGAL